MNAIDDLRYMRTRAVQEQQAAKAAQCGTARECHERLAARYEARAMQLAIGLQLGGGASLSIRGMSELG